MKLEHVAVYFIFQNGLQVVPVDLQALVCHGDSGLLRHHVYAFRPQHPGAN